MAVVNAKQRVNIREKSSHSQQIADLSSESFLAGTVILCAAAPSLKWMNQLQEFLPRIPGLQVKLIGGTYKSTEIIVWLDKPTRLGKILTEITPAVNVIKRNRDVVVELQPVIN